MPGSNELILNSFQNNRIAARFSTTIGSTVSNCRGTSQPAMGTVSSATLVSDPSYTQATSKCTPLMYRFKSTTPSAKSDVNTAPIAASVGTRPN